MSELTMQQAQMIASAALSKAREMDLNPMTVAIVDTSGTTKWLQREDGSCATLRPDIALGKARAAIVMGPKGSRFWQTDYAARPNFVQTLMHLSDGNFLPGAGGVAILSESGEPLGGIGCTGDLSDKDEAIAIHGVLSARLLAEPSEPKP